MKALLAIVSLALLAGCQFPFGIKKATGGLGGLDIEGNAPPALDPLTADTRQGHMAKCGTWYDEGTPEHCTCLEIFSLRNTAVFVKHCHTVQSPPVGNPLPQRRLTEQPAGGDCPQCPDCPPQRACPSCPQCPQSPCPPCDHEAKRSICIDANLPHVLDRKAPPEGQDPLTNGALTQLWYDRDLIRDWCEEI